MSSLWRIELLGWLRARANERIVTRFRTQQTAGLLAYLAYYPHHPHPRDERGKNAATTCWRTAFLNQKLSSRKTIYRQGLVRASSPVRRRPRRRPLASRRIDPRVPGEQIAPTELSVTFLYLLPDCCVRVIRVDADNNLIHLPDPEEDGIIEPRPGA